MLLACQEPLLAATNEKKMGMGKRQYSKTGHHPYIIVRWWYGMVSLWYGMVNQQCCLVAAASTADAGDVFGNKIIKDIYVIVMLRLM